MAVLFMKYTIYAIVNPRHVVHQCCGDIVWHSDILSAYEVCFVGFNILRCHVSFDLHLPDKSRFEKVGYIKAPSKTQLLFKATVVHVLILLLLSLTGALASD